MKTSYPLREISWKDVPGTLAIWIHQASEINRHVEKDTLKRRNHESPATQITAVTNLLPVPSAAIFSPSPFGNG
jgi:hypothetical protein